MTMFKVGDRVRRKAANSRIIGYDRDHVFTVAEINTHSANGSPTFRIKNLCGIWYPEFFELVAPQIIEEYI